MLAATLGADPHRSRYNAHRTLERYLSPAASLNYRSPIRATSAATSAIRIATVARKVADHPWVPSLQLR
jgi:hypothetical protein